MFPANDKVLPSGEYVIVNAQHNRSLIFDEDEGSFSTVAGSQDYKWTVTLLKNKKWSIQGPSEIFPDIGPQSEVGEDMVLTRKPPRPPQWVIKRRSESDRTYIIYSPLQSRLFWSLPDAEDGTVPQWSADYEDGCSHWRFARVIDESHETKVPPVVRPEPVQSDTKNTFSVIIPRGWITTVSSVSGTDCTNLVRVCQSGVSEPQDFVGGWDTVGKEMSVGGTDEDSLALAPRDDSCLLSISVYHSRDRTKTQPSDLPNDNPSSTRLRVVTTSRPKKITTFPDYQIFTIFDETTDTTGHPVSQNAVITVHILAHTPAASLNSPLPDSGIPTANEHPPQFSETSFTSGLNPSTRGVLYYRVYDKDGPVASKRPAYKDDPYLGRILTRWLAPPYQSARLKLFLSSMESISDVNQCTLFASLWSTSPLDDGNIDLGGSDAIGATPDKPVAITTKINPTDGLTPNTESRLLKMDERSPVKQQWLYYRVYDPAGPVASKHPAYSDDQLIGRVPWEWVSPPHRVEAVKRLLCSMENITEPGDVRLFTIPWNPTELLNDVAFLLGDSQVLGVAPDRPLALLCKVKPASGVKRMAGLQSWSETRPISLSKRIPSPQRMLYYRIYGPDGPLLSKRPAYKNDRTIGRVLCSWIPPPHQAGTVKAFLCQMENIENPSAVCLFATPSSSTEVSNDTAITLDESQTFGLTPRQPLILRSELKPLEGMKLTTESLLIPPENRSPVAPRPFYYGLYSEAGVVSSKLPISPEEDWISRIDANQIPPPLTLGSVRALIRKREEAFVTKVFTNEEGVLALENHVNIHENPLVGSSSEKHIMVRIQDSMKFTGSPPIDPSKRYKLLSCSTDRQLEFKLGYENLANNTGCYFVGYVIGNYDESKFRFRRQPDGGFSIQNGHRQWAGPDLTVTSNEDYMYYLISKPDENLILLCVYTEQHGLRAITLTDVTVNNNVNYKRIILAKPNFNDLKQLWRLSAVD